MDGPKKTLKQIIEEQHQKTAAKTKALFENVKNSGETIIMIDEPYTMI